MTALVLSLRFGAGLHPLAEVGAAAMASRSALDGPERHLIEKKGTPTMGGVLILVALGDFHPAVGQPANGYVWVVLLLTLGYGAIGFVDDYIKLAQAEFARAVGARQAAGCRRRSASPRGIAFMLLTREPLATGLRGAGVQGSADPARLSPSRWWR